MQLLTLWYVLVCLVCLHRGYIASEQTSSKGDVKKQLSKRNVGVQLGNLLQRSLAGQNMAPILNNSLWSQFTPNTPAPDEVDCHIEIEVTQLVGGRCVRLGGLYRMAVCQSGVHLDFTRNQCEQILSEREQANEQAQSVQPETRQQQHEIKRRSVEGSKNDQARSTGDFLSED